MKYKVIDQTRIIEKKIYKGHFKKSIGILGRGLVLDEDNQFSEEDMKEAFPLRWEKNIKDLINRKIIAPVHIEKPRFKEEKEKEEKMEKKGGD